MVTSLENGDEAQIEAPEMSTSCAGGGIGGLASLAVDSPVPPILGSGHTHFWRNPLYGFESSLNWLLGLAPSSLGLQELASQVGSINYPLALMVSPA